MDIGERSLFVRCSGTEAPVVVLEAGLTGNHHTWDLVVAEMGDARVCAYDRANIGRSDEAPTPRSAADAADDLRALVDAIDIELPIVLVGFSFGGLIAQVFAAQHPEEVGGIVLIESNHPDEVEQFEAQLTADQIAADRAAQANDEGIDVYASFAAAQSAGALPEVPLVVVTAVGPIEWPSGWDPTVFNQLRAEQQADLAASVPGGVQVFAEDSGHEVPSDQPSVVVDAIQRVLSDLP